MSNPISKEHIFKRIRKKKNLTQHQLAELIGVSREQVSQAEQGNMKVRYQTAASILAKIKEQKLWSRPTITDVDSRYP